MWDVSFQMSRMKSVIYSWSLTDMKERQQTQVDDVVRCNQLMHEG